MAAKYICDGCGKEEQGIFFPDNPHDWHKPEKWFQRSDESGPQDCCSRKCIEIVAAKTGKSSVVLPL